MRNAKAKGSRNERRCRDILLKEGYYVCKAGGSLGIWDIIALNPSLDAQKGIIRLVQVKSNRKPRPAEMSALKSFVAHPTWSKELWIWKDYQRTPIIEVLP